MPFKRQFSFFAAVLALAAMPIDCSGARPPPPDQHMGAGTVRQLDFPIPKATHVVELSRARLFNGQKGTLGEVAQNLTNLLTIVPRRNNLGWYSLPFETPSGFAVLGPIEPIDGQGHSTRDRFSSPPSRFSWKYLMELVTGVDAHYRVMLFIITDQTIVPDADTTTAWLNSHEKRPGSTNIPDSLATLGYNEHYRCNLFIYEFSRNGAVADGQILPPSGALDAMTHLREWNLETAVETNTPQQ